MAPGGPCFPVEAIVVSTFGHLVGLVVEDAFLYAVFLRAGTMLDIAKQGMIDKLLQLFNFGFIGLYQLLHHGAEPAACSALVTQTGYPNAAILRYLLLLFVIISDH